METPGRKGTRGSVQVLGRVARNIYSNYAENSSIVSFETDHIMNVYAKFILIFFIVSTHCWPIVIFFRCYGLVEIIIKSSTSIILLHFFFVFMRRMNEINQCSSYRLHVSCEMLTKETLILFHSDRDDS